MDTQQLAVFRKRFGNINTLSEFFKNNYRPALTEIARRLPAEEGAAFSRHWLRYFEPWPDWVLRISVEILQVHLPTIPKPTMNDSLRFVHDVIFVLKLDGSSPKDSFKCPDFAERELGALLGHMAVLITGLLLKVNRAFQEKIISSEDFKKYAGELSIERMQHEIQPYLIELLKVRPTEQFGLYEGFEKAKQNTFDKHGSLQETTLTNVYAEIFTNWPEIEELSGPTALCNFLSPVLKGNENLPEMRLDRVNKICQRMGIRFKPFVRG